MPNKDSFKKMVEIMETLRSENGCPWDREQNHQTLKSNLLEESYEVLEALEEESMEKLKEELGDLLLQILFHSQLAKEEGFFCIDDVIEGLAEKIIRRHPHVFSNVSVSGSEEVKVNWDKIKRQEQKNNGKPGKKSILDGIPKMLPSLIRAYQIQSRASRVGFDFPDVDQALGKVDEEMEEFKEAISKNNHSDIEEELGDLLFSLVNVSRFLKVDSEEAMRKTIAKFTTRFKVVEETIMSSGKDFKETSLKEMDAIWDMAKKHYGN